MKVPVPPAPKPPRVRVKPEPGMEDDSYDDSSHCSDSDDDEEKLEVCVCVCVLMMLGVSWYMMQSCRRSPVLSAPTPSPLHTHPACMHMLPASSRTAFWRGEGPSKRAHTCTHTHTHMRIHGSLGCRR